MNYQSQFVDWRSCFENRYKGDLSIAKENADTSEYAKKVLKVMEYDVKV
jgi:hypothetical protein